MHELRKDPLLSRWVTVLSHSKPAEEYERLPEHTDEETPCILCSGREADTPHEIASIRGNPSEWLARVIPKPKPVFQIEGELGRKGVGMYDRMNNIGANEIIIETPVHDKRPEDMGNEQMKRVFTLYKMRMTDIERDGRIRYVFVCKNSGRGAGAVYSHPYSEIFATPVIPKLIKQELDSAKQYYSYKERCIFCDIMSEELRMTERIIAETQHFICFCPYAPKFPFEFWVMPKRHSCAFQDIMSEELDDLGRLMTSLIKRMRNVLNEPAFNYVIHTAPNRMPRKDHWHSLGDDFHWHIEVTPRLIRASGFEWGADFYVLSTSPEHAAKYMREP